MSVGLGLGLGCELGVVGLELGYELGVVGLELTGGLGCVWSTWGASVDLESVGQLADWRFF